MKLLALLIVTFASVAAADGPPPVFSLTGAPVNAGSVEVTTGAAMPSVMIRNSGGGTLIIKSVQVVNGAIGDWGYVARGTCAGPIPSFCNLAADQEVTLDLRFDPTDIGTRSSTLLINYFDTADRSAIVPLLGKGLGGNLQLVGGPLSIDFGSVPVGMMSTVAFGLVNRGNLPVSDVDLSIMPAGVPFSVSPSSPLTLMPDVEAAITVTCRPTSAGTFTTTLHASSAMAFMSSPIAITATCAGSNTPLYATPTTISVGDVRTGSMPATPIINVLGTSPLTISAIALETATANLSVSATPGPTPVTATLQITPTTDGNLANAILVTATGGEMIRIPIAGQVVTATYQAPPLTSLGTFCVNQPTTASTIALSSLGTASIRLGVPMLALDATSPFDVAPVLPSNYPATLLAGHDAVLEVTPKRQAAPGVVVDELIWTTDVADLPMARTMLSATFINDGGAIAPSALGFGQVPIHSGTSNAQSVTLQNCDTTPITLGTPTMPAAFAIASGTFPMRLEPNERTTIAVGFRPVRVGVHGGVMQIPSEQLAAPLVVTLTGEGINTSNEGDGGPDVDGIDQRSFYGCDGCTTHQPGSAVLIVLVVLGIMRGRSPNGSSSARRRTARSPRASCRSAARSGRPRLDGDRRRTSGD